MTGLSGFKCGNQSAARSRHCGFIRSISHIFFISTPALELLLASDRFANTVVLFPIDETDCVVAVSESLELVSFVLEDAVAEIVRHSNVESTA